MGEDSFHPRLEIIQVASGDMIAIIDYQSVSKLAPFFSLLDDARILKVLHAGRQDLEIFSVLSGSVPTPVFDTQVEIGRASCRERVSTEGGGGAEQQGET